ncbi:unannotated protein [freshwater metagenome]|uniref:Unannotated protein n=1 Tax=freshwater metagenome TaxID=449393 RepID=A0A6J6CCZ2_9ZZZZ
MYARFDFLATWSRMRCQEERTWLAVIPVSTIAIGVVAGATGAEAFSVIGAATIGIDEVTSPPIPIRRSKRSIRASEPTSVAFAAGTKIFAHISSRCSFGLVAPVMLDKESLTLAAA